MPLGEVPSEAANGRGGVQSILNNGLSMLSPGFMRIPFPSLRASIVFIIPDWPRIHTNLLRLEDDVLSPYRIEFNLTATVICRCARCRSLPSRQLLAVISAIVIGVRSGLRSRFGGFSPVYQEAFQRRQRYDHDRYTHLCH